MARVRYVGGSFGVSRPYKMRRSYHFGTLEGTEPEYVDCKAQIAANPSKYSYTNSDYPCASESELAAYGVLSRDSNISRCYDQVTGGSISHASKYVKMPLPDGALMLDIPTSGGFINDPGERTMYNVNKDCSITVSSISLSTGHIIHEETISRGQFNEKFKIGGATTPTPEPDTGDGNGGIDIGGIDIDSITQFVKDNMILVVGGGVAIIAVAFVASKVLR